MINHTTTDLIALSEFQQFLIHPLVPLKGLQDFEGKPMEKIVPYQMRHGLLPFMGNPMERTKGLCAYFFKHACKHHWPQQDFSTKHHWFYMYPKRKHQNTCKNKSCELRTLASSPKSSSSLAHLKNTFQ